MNPRVIWRMWVPMRDGIRLSARLYLPADTTAAPALLTMTPYAIDLFHEDAMAFAEAGYTVVIVDCRGRGDSEGAFTPSEVDAEDGYDCVEWIAAQPWCDGAVGMWGGSYAGECQWNVATLRPPHLRSIAPAAATHNPADYPWRGPVRMRYALLWLLLVSGRAASPMSLFRDHALWQAAYLAHHQAGAAFADLPRFMGGGSEHFDRFVAHPFHDPFWHDQAFPQAFWETLDIPVLTITGQNDDAQRGALTYVREHETHGAPAAIAQHFVVVGPWDHAGTRSGQARIGGHDFGAESALDLRALTLGWFDWTLRGGPRPAFLRDRVAIYMSGAREWRYASCLTGERAELTLRLHPHGASEGLVARQGEVAGAALAWHSDPADLSLSSADAVPPEVWLTDPRVAGDTGAYGLCFETAPLTEPLELEGWVRLTLHLSADVPDADLQAILAEIDSGGTILKLTEDFARLRYRDSDREPRLMRPGEAARITLHGFTWIARRLAPGSRLRLIVQTPRALAYQRNFQGGGDVDRETIADGLAGRIEVHTGAAHPSALVLPIARGDSPP